MTKLEILEMLEEMVGESERAVYASDDPSGVSTKYLIDAEEFREAIRKRILEEKNPPGRCDGLRGD